MHFSAPLAFLGLLLASATVSAQFYAPPSCTTLNFSKKVTDRWEATLNFKVSKQLNGVWIKVDLDDKADALITDLGETTSTNNRDYIIRRPDLGVAPGGTITAKLVAKFSGVGVAPNISRITVNGITVCPPEPGVEPVDSRVETAENQAVQYDKDACGVVPEAQSLIFNGELSTEGAWPWHIAMMKIDPPAFRYSCGGSIISESYILTAAHCVTFQRTRSLVSVQSFLLYVGVTKLTNLNIPSVKVFTAADIFIPDDYSPETYHNDVALIRLASKIEFTNFIRPVCLWSESTDESTITGRKGTVVGWGIDQQNQSFSRDLRHAEIPVVSLQTCRQSGNFYRKHTTERTYCAGGEEGKSVCNGDSGGGMIFRKPGTSGANSVWQIRGVVSVNRKAELNDVCNTKGYAIFADVAKHLDWIKRTAGVA